MLIKARRNAKRKGIIFNLEKEDIIIPEECPVLGIPLKIDGDYRTGNTPSLDRFNSKLGYTKDNINIISWRTNLLKNNGTIEEFKKLISWLEIKSEEARLAPMA